MAAQALGAEGQALMQRRVRGVRLANGEVLRADVVVANPDLPYAYETLLAGQYEDVERESKGISEDMEYSCGMIEFCWALKQPMPELAQHNVFLGSASDGPDPSK